jgi:hypothetical protein
VLLSSGPAHRWILHFFARWPSGGYATGNYNSTSTVAMAGGYSTYNIPYNVSRNDFFASYWHRQLPLKTKVPFAALVGMAGDNRNKEGDTT